MLPTNLTPRQILSFVVLGGFLTLVLLLGISKEAGEYARDIEDSLTISSSNSIKKPDFEQYVHFRSLSDEELAFDNSDRRVLFVGDIHGMKASFDKLLDKLNYTPKSDLIIHTGDIVAKGPLLGSLDVLKHMAAQNVTGVRGNHDQVVIGWQAWIEHVLDQRNGLKWLKEMERKSKKEMKTYLKDVKHGVTVVKEPWKQIPEDWEFMGDHYQIARGMTAEQATYLRSLPLVLHIPRLHAFVVHAGLLPLDPRRSPTSLHQPLAHLPHSRIASGGKLNVTWLRTKQEEAVLSDVPQNTDLWTLENMRSILDDNTVTRKGAEGTPWSPLWNAIVRRCGGFDANRLSELEGSDGKDEGEDEDIDIEDDEEAASKLIPDLKRPKSLPCHPATVIYGHAASRGLDLHRWSKGLDSGCVYGRYLTALVLTNPASHRLDDDDLDEESVERNTRFGDAKPRTANARIRSVSCPEL